MTDAGAISWFEFVKRADANVPIILPIGAFEQHGPHLPLATDAIIAAALGGAIADGAEGLTLPVLSYGAPSRPRSGGGDLFPAPAVDIETLLATVQSVVAGAVGAGARRIVVLSWHYENQSVLWDAAWRALTGTESAKALVFADPWQLISDDVYLDLLPPGLGRVDPAAGHAGFLETGIMRALAPHLVGQPSSPVSFRPRQYDVLPTPRDAVPETGVVYDAGSVAAEAGQRCFDAMVSAITDAIAAEG
jgi:creatinine amidohydrolase